jgi:hypothetical protein
MNMASDAASEEPSDAAPEETAPREQPEQQQPAGAARADQDATPARPAPVQPTPSAPILPAQSREDTDVGWGDYAERDDNDRLLRDRPPHWDDA